jgi:hypothetical protein
MTEFDERLEGEMKSHESEMLRKAVIHKYGSKTLAERIAYIKTTFPLDTTAEDVFAKMTELGISGSDTIEDVKKLF